MSGKFLMILELLCVCCMLKSLSSCPEGYNTGFDGNCTDLDECEDESTRCGKHSICLNTPGSFHCNCSPGFKERNNRINFNALNGQCEDIHECLDDPGICGSGARCSNLIGNYSCTCLSGYTKLDDSGNRCHDIDECEDHKKQNEDYCGVNSTCKNMIGSFQCECPSGYSNYGNEKTPCSELKCDQFRGASTHSQTDVSLTDILSQMRKSCLALSQPDRSGNKTEGTVLLNSLFNMTEDLLSSNNPGDSITVNGLLTAVEESIKFIGPQLGDDQTSVNTSQTEAKIVVWKRKTPPIGPVHLTNTNASLETDWKTAIGNGTYPGFALAALVSYRNLEKTLNQSFEPHILPQKQGKDPSYRVFSKVISAVVSNPSTKHLDHPVIITLRHLQEEEESAQVSYTCAYWKSGEDGQDEGGAWSTDGCSRHTSNATHTVCSCNHLSSFAVLMALYPMEHTFGLMLLTKLGLSISLLCLAMCILTFKFCRSIQGTRTTIHLHLCVCLFTANLIFLTGISQTKPEGGCRLVAALLHFFFLGAFSWMLLEGVQLYRMVVLVFNATIRPRYLFAVGYGVPFAIVTISAISRPTGYGTEKYCWLSLAHHLIWSFYGPVCVVIILNVFFFIVTVWKLAQKFSSLNPDLTNLHKIKAFTITAIAQLCVLGLMWLSGAFLFEEGAVVPAYIFTTLNSLQGALIFLLNCLLSKQVRDEYSKLLSCVCPQKQKSFSEFSSTNRSSQSKASRSGQHTGDSVI